MAAAPELAFTGVSASPAAYDAAPGLDLWRAAVDERFFDVVGQQPLLGGFMPDDFEWTFANVENGAVWQTDHQLPHVAPDRWRRPCGARTDNRHRRATGTEPAGSPVATAGRRP